MVDGQLKRFCDQCAACGQRSRLKLYQINFDEAYYMCENIECSYPLEIEDRFSESLIKRDSSSITTPAQRRAQAAAAALVETSTPPPPHLPSRPASAPNSVKSSGALRAATSNTLALNNNLTNSVLQSNNNNKLATTGQRTSKNNSQKSFGSSKLSPVQFTPGILAKLKTVDTTLSKSASKSSVSVLHKKSETKPQTTAEIDQKYLDKFSKLLDENFLLSKPKETRQKASPSPVTELCDLLPDGLIDASVKSNNPRPSGKRKSRASTPTNSLVSKKQRIGDLFLQEATKKCSDFPSTVGKRLPSSTSGGFHSQSSVKDNPETKIKPPELIKKILKDARERPEKATSVLGANKFAPFVLDSSSLPQKDAKNQRNVFAACGKSNAGVKRVLSVSKPAGLSCKPNFERSTFAPEQTTLVDRITTKTKSVKTKPHPTKVAVNSSTSCEDFYCDSFDISLFDDSKTPEQAPKKCEKSAKELVFEKLLDSVNRSTFKLKQTFTESAHGTNFIQTEATSFGKSRQTSWDQTSDGCSVNSSLSSSPKLSPLHVKTSCESVVNIDSLLLDAHRESDSDQGLSCIFSGSSKRGVRNSTSVQTLD